MLEEFVMIEKSKGVISQSEINRAYTLLGGNANDETSARRIIDIFRYAVSYLLGGSFDYFSVPILEQIPQSWKKL